MRSSSRIAAVSRCTSRAPAATCASRSPYRPRAVGRACAKLFRRFQQADGAPYGGALRRQRPRAGDQHRAGAGDGRRIGVESTPGEGSTFHVELPLREVTWRSRPAGTADGSRVMSLLLVEDDPTVAEVVAGLLRAQGHRVAHVPHGLAALTEARLATYDVALLDLDLPGPRRLRAGAPAAARARNRDPARRGHRARRRRIRAAPTTPASMRSSASRSPARCCGNVLDRVGRPVSA